jgi:hypothetical protein
VKRFRKINNQNGAAMVEFAIVLPLLLILVFGVIEFGVMFYNKAVITNASREGARAGITGLTNSKIETIVKDYCNTNLINIGNVSENDLNPMRPDPDDPEGPPIGDPDDDIIISDIDAQNDLTVRVEYGYDFLLGSLLGFTKTIIEAQTVMRME